MVTKNIFHVQALGTDNTFNVNGFLTAIIDVNVTEFSSLIPINIYGDVTSSVDSNSPRQKVWVDDVLISSVPVLQSAGKHRLVVDLTNVKYLRIVRGTIVGTCNICFTPYVVEKNTDLYMGGQEFVYDVCGKKQIDIKIEKIYKYTTNIKYVRLYKSNDGNTWENFTEANSAWGVTIGGYTDITNVDSVELYANVENVNFLKVVIASHYLDVYRVNTTIHSGYIEGREFDLNVRGNTLQNASTMASLFKGYRYVKIEFSNTTVSTGYGALTYYVGENDVPFARLLNSKFNIIETPYYLDRYGFATITSNQRMVPLIGNAIGGGIVFDFEKPLTNGVRFRDNKSSGSDIVFGSFHITLYKNKPSVESEEIVADRNDYVVKDCKIQLPNAKRDVFGADVIEYTSDKIHYYQFGYNGILWEIQFDSNTVEALQDGETIKYAYLIPYNQNNAVGSLNLPNRIIVFTNKNRLLFNYDANIYDLMHFKEAKITNPYKKWQAVNDSSKVDAVHKYFPVLKDYDYEQFENRGAAVIQGTSVGNLLLDFPNQAANWNRNTWCNMSRSNKVVLFGNYNTYNTEPFVIGTVDGGKTWKVVIWFAFVSGYPGVGGGRIDLTPISSQAAYTANSLKLCIRDYRVPTDEVKEPADTFIIDEAKQVNVSSFSTDSNGDTLVNLSTGIDFGTYSPVCFFKNNGAANVWDYICNNDMTEDGANSNGIFFRLQKISNTQYKLLANLGNPYEPSLTCFHIHCVNRTCAGFTISTGESYNPTAYEGGMIYFLTQNYNNGSNKISGGIDTLLNKTFRLTSSPNGVNRACGTYIFNDEKDPTVVYVSDESFYTSGKRNATIPGRTVELKNVPTGIFMGKLSDIDDQSKYECVCETRGTMLSLFEWNGHFAADGHSESVCFSKDGKNWNQESNSYFNTINGCDVEGNIYFGDYKVEFK